MNATKLELLKDISMNIENTVTINVNLKPETYTLKYNLILLENSNITTEKLLEIIGSFYSQSPKACTFIFDFSSDVNNLVDFTPIMNYVEEYGYPEWSYRVCNPIWLGNTDAPTATAQRLNICSDVVQSFFGNYGTCKIESVWCEMQEE